MLFLIALIGFAAVRKGVVGDEAVNGLTRLLIDVIVPAQMLVSMMEGLTEETLTQAGAVMLAMVAWNLLWLLFGWIATRLWPGGNPEQNRAIMVLSSFQNGIYVPLPLILALVPREMHSEATVLIGGAVTVMILTQWSLAIILLRGGRYTPKPGASAFDALKATLNPPMLSIFAGGLLSLVPVCRAAARGEDAPGWISVPVLALDTLGGSLAPIAMILLGMLIGRCHLSGVLNARTVTIPVVLKMILAPLAMLWALSVPGLFGWVPPLVALVLIVQAAAPPATNLSVIARRYEGDWQLVAAMLMVTYVTALVTMPLFTAIVMAR